MKERGILFSAPMVRAILDGSKTQTRRTVKAKHLAWIDNSVANFLDGKWDERPLPYGKRGDRLWVREAFRIGAWNEEEGSFAIDYRDGPRREWLTVPDDEEFDRLWVQCCDELRAKKINPGEDGNYHWQPGESPLRWRPGIHMFRWASRITLEITGVRVERLQDISEADAIAEGCFFTDYGKRCWHRTGPPQNAGDCPHVDSHQQKDGWMWSPTTSSDDCLGSAVAAFGNLWCHVNGLDSWAANPMVWVISFKRIEGAKAAA